MSDASVCGEAALCDGAVAPDVTSIGGVPKALVEVGSLVVGTLMGFSRDDASTLYLTLTR